MQLNIPPNARPRISSGPARVVSLAALLVVAAGVPDPPAADPPAAPVPLAERLAPLARAPALSPDDTGIAILLLPERRPIFVRNADRPFLDRKSTRLNSSHDQISYAVFC